MTRLSSVSSSVFSSALLFSAVIALAGGCAPDSVDHVEPRSRAVSLGADPGNLDILFMIDNSSSMTTTQMKLLTQDPSFMTVLQNLPNGLPNIHVAVVSSDMGAPGDSTSSIACTKTGDNGVFQSTPRGTCTNSTLASGATFISNVDGVANYTGNLTDVFGCIAQLGQSGCGFEHQLASVARALGADGAPPPSANVGFLRDDAELAIVLLTNEDDCSAPSNTTLYSLNGAQQNIANPLGPIANYRCNQFGHLCMDPASAAPTVLIAPPLTPPADAQGTATAPTLNMTNCESNDTGSGMLTSVADLVAGIRALKADPDNQIVVGAIAPPVTPYTVAWVPESGGQNPQPGELWPQIEHSCGAPGGDDVNPLATQLISDGSFGDPGVRIAQWVHAFGSNGVVASICDADYSISFQTIADKIGMHLQGSGTGGTGGAGGTNGGVAGAGGHGNVGGSSGAGGSGVAGNGGPGGAGGTVGGTGGTGGAGNGGPGTGGAGNGGPGTGGGNGAAGAGGNGANSGATGGQAGAGAQSATGGVSGAAGTGGNAAAGASGAGTGGNAAAGASGSGTGGNAAAGASGSGTGGNAAAGASGAGTGGAAAAGASGSGTGGAAAAGASGTETGGAGGHSETGGHAGNGSGTGGTTEGASSGGCSCDTGASSPSGVGLALLLGALALLAKRRRGAS